MQRQVIVGTLLGDASMPLRKGKPTLRVEFQQTRARAEYIWHLYEIFENFVGTPPRVKNIRGGGARDRQSLRFHTYGHPEFKFYDEIFYTIDDPEGPGLRRKKRVPESINELFTAIALAYWFMDDGSHTSGKNRTYRFSTQSFPLSDQERLIQALIHNFGIYATIQKHYSYYMLYIRSESANRFVDLIRPYIHPCFYYKIQ